MAGEYYNHTTFPQTGAVGSSAQMRAELELIEAGFNKLPDLTGNANKLIRINAAETSQETVLNTVLQAADTVAATAKTTLANADLFAFVDSAASNTYKKVTWQNIVATLDTTFLKSGDAINGSSIGATTPSTGAFTTLSSTGNASLGDAEATDTHAIKGATTVLANSASAALTVTQTGTGNAFVVEDSTSPDATPFVIDNAGRIGIGGIAGAGQNLFIRRTIDASESVNPISALVQNQFSGTLTSVTNFQSQIRLDPSATVSGIAAAYRASGLNLGVGATVTTQVGFEASAGITGATNNYGFYGNIPSGTGRWNFYAAGTALNYFNGDVGIGVTAPAAKLDVLANTSEPAVRITQTGAGNAFVVEDSTSPDATPFVIDNAGRIGIGLTPVAGQNFRISSPITGNVSSYGQRILAEIKSDATSAAIGYESLLSTEATTFWLGSLYHFIAGQGTFGAGSTVTNQYGFNAQSSLIGATNNYGFYSNIPSGTGRWNFYAAGTAANYFNGTTWFGSTAGSTGLSITTSFAGAQSNITANSATGGQIDLDHAVGDGAGGAAVRLFRSTTTTGNGLFQIFLGDGTTSINHTLHSKNNQTSSLCANNGNLNLGNASGKVDVLGSFSTRYVALTAGTTAMGFGVANVVRVTPNATATYTTTVPSAGAIVVLSILTSGTTSYTITFGTGFKSTGTLATGTTSARYFNLTFVSDGTNLIETDRTVAIA